MRQDAATGIDFERDSALMGAEFLLVYGKSKASRIPDNRRGIKENPRDTDRIDFRT